MKHFKVLILLIILIIQTLKADIVKAYSFYLTKDFDSSLVYYQLAHKNNPLNSDAYYGIINCYTLMGDYKKGIDWCDSALSIKYDHITAQKKIYLLGLIKDNKEAQKLYKQALENKPDSTTLKGYLNSISYGLLYSEDYKNAVKWFLLADSSYKNDTLFKSGLVQAIDGKKEILQYSLSLLGGIGRYTHELLNDEEGPFSYNNSYFYNGTFIVSHRKKHTFTFEYTNTNISFLDSYYGYNITPIDTLTQNQTSPLEHYKNSEIPYQIVAYPNTATPNIYDSLYYIYLMNVDTFTSKSYNNSSYDTIVRIDIQNVYEHDFYVSLKDHYSLLKKASLGLGIRYTYSNIFNSQDVITLWGVHEHTIKKGLIKSNYYYSFLPNYYIGQWSPLLYIQPHLKFGFGLQGNFLKAFPKNEESIGITKDLQFSGDFYLDLILSKLTISSITSFGSRTYLNEYEGRILNNTNSDIKIIQKLFVDISPLPIPVSLFLGGNGYLYKTHKKLSILGGLTYKW